MPIPHVVKTVRGLSLKSVEKANSWSRIVHAVMWRKANHVWKHVGSYVQGKKILDVGMGSGSIAYFLNKKGFSVTSVDVDDLSIYNDLKPIIYDGHKLPFRDKEFDSAVIIHVLHHCQDGLEVLKETMRVAKRVIFIEDTFRNGFEWFLVSVFDSLTNGELWWHKYRSVSDWTKIIKKYGWRLTATSEWSEVTSPYGRYCLFVIE